jgi:hypothetical protein
MPKKENSTENKALLEEMFECAMANNFNAFSKLLDNKDEHSLVEDDANLGACLMMMAQAINSEPDIIKREDG